MKTSIYKLIILFVILIYGVTNLFAENVLRERVYIQTDKDLYLAGELLWLKMLLTDDKGVPASLSKVGYVELLDENTSQAQAKIELKNGAGEGWLEIPLSLPTGNYRIVGYTQYMRNEAEEVCFEKYLSVINTFRTDRTIEVSSSSANSPVSKIVPVNTINIETDNKLYSTRENGIVRLSGLPENVHSLSLSIAGSDLQNNLPEVTIQSWRNKLNLSSTSAFSGNYLPEYEGPIIKGRIVNVNNENVKIDEEIMPLIGFVGNTINLFSGLQKSGDEVTVFAQHITGKEELVSTVISPSSDKYRIDIQSPFMEHKPHEIPMFRLNSDWQERLLQRSVGLQVLHAFTSDSMNLLASNTPHFRYQPDWVYNLDDYTRFMTVEETVIEFIMALRFRRISGRRVLSVLNEERTGFTMGNSLVLLDGIPIVDHEVIFRYDPYLLSRIEIFKGKFVFGEQLFDGVASFYTYGNDYPALSVDNTYQFYDYPGPQAKRYFYAPDYISDTQKKSRVPDYRHTLLWKPEIEMKGTHVVEIPFSTSDLSGEYKVVVEGLTSDGSSIFGQVGFNVEQK